MTQEERERVIELLLGQDKVIALLYDKQESKPQFNGDVPSDYQQWQMRQQMEMQQQMQEGQEQMIYQQQNQMMNQ